MPLTYTENFEDTEDLDEKWSVINTGTTHPWIIYDEVSGASGDHALMLPNRSLSAGDVSEIWSQPIDLSDTTAEITMTFKYAYARRNPGNNERLMLWVSGNCGESWSLKGIWNNDFETVSYTNSYWIPSSPSHWETVTIDNISMNHLVSNFRYKFQFDSDGGNNIFIDDININGISTVNVIELQNSGSITVFPNPAQGYLNLNINGRQSYTFQMQLLNTVGQTVWAESNLKFGGGTESYIIETSDFGAGVYLLLVETESGEKSVQRVLLIR